ncbi:hypothetical protein NXS19_008803 [Fusarium pseudograminearum]|nr:hypothetical protein NXS19_008803 [Fusarium pseudograminearum]
MSAYAREGSPYGFDSSRMSPTATSPRGKTFVEGYRNEIINGFEKDNGLYNPMNPERPQSSALVDLRDPIQVHLLTETALSDSKEYEILSQEEVDDLKKQCQSLSQRVESTRQNLTIQSKYRDAAISMARLYNPGKLEGKRRSLLGRNSGDQARAKEAETERQASERKCEELAAELFNLEKRLMEPQRRLLEHTAGILQLTHKASNKKKDMTPTLHPMNGMPGSPESLYTYTRNSMDRAGDEHFFNDDNHFDQANGISTRGPPRQQPIEIPLKSPIREQHSQLKELEKIKDENLLLKGQSDSLVTSITEMEARLENLNGSLRDAIVRFNPSKNEDYYDPPFGVPGMKPGELLNNQMDYLEMGLNAIEVEQEESSGEQGKVDGSIEKRIESLNQQVRDLLMTVDPEYPAAPQSSEDTVESKLAYLEDALRAADSELERAIQVARSGPPEKQDDEQVERILMNLWNMMQTGFTKIKKEKEERRRTRIERGYEDEEVSDDEFDIDEAFSLPGFSNRVQWLYSQTTTLANQKSILKRQIKQQRELNNKSDAEKDEELARKQEELDETQVLLARAERDASTAHAMLEQTLEQLEGTGVARNIGAQKAASEESTKKIDELESELKRLQSDLAGAAGAAGAAHAQVEDREDKIDSLEKSSTTSDLILPMQRLPLLLPRLRLTIVRARSLLWNPSWLIWRQPRVWLRSVTEKSPHLSLSLSKPTPPIPRSRSAMQSLQPFALKSRRPTLSRIRSRYIVLPSLLSKPNWRRPMISKLVSRNEMPGLPASSPIWNYFRQTWQGPQGPQGPLKVSSRSETAGSRLLRLMLSNSKRSWPMPSLLATTIVTS